MTKAVPLLADFQVQDAKDGGSSFFVAPPTGEANEPVAADQVERITPHCHGELTGSFCPPADDQPGLCSPWNTACIEMIAAPLKYSPYGVAIMPMAVAEHTTEPFYDEVTDVLPILFVVIYLYAVYNITSTFIIEKETKIRESLRIGGVGNWTLIISWYLVYGAVYFVMAVLMTAASLAGLFGTASGLLLFVFYWISLMAIMAYSFALHTLFNKAKTGGIVGAILFVSSFMVWASVKGASVPALVKTLVSFMPGVAFCFGIEVLPKTPDQHISLAVLHEMVC